MADRSENATQRAARQLDVEHTRGTRFASLAGDDAPQSIDDAYDVQDALVALRSAAGRGVRAGHKIALTTPAMRNLLGYDDSVAGQVLAANVRHSPTVAPLHAAGHFGFECELAFLIGSDTKADACPATRDAMAAHIAGICAAFELIDDRNADYTRFAREGRAALYSLAADNAWNAGVVLSEWQRDWRGLDLAAVHGVATINGDVVGEGYGRDVLGHPLDAMLWIARHLRGRGQRLRAGEFVITGSLVASRFPHAGDAVVFAVGGVGEVRMQVAD